MTDLPKRVFIKEEGPREGFQIEPGPIPTASKIALIDRLSETGLDHIQIVSFVNPKRVPGMADAEQVVAGIQMKPGVQYTGLWLNEQGLERAVATKRLHLDGKLTLYASNAFLRKNQNRTPEEQLAAQPRLIEGYRKFGVPMHTGFVTAAFGCNFEGDIDPAHVVELVSTMRRIAKDNGEHIDTIGLADTMAWATPERIKRTVGMVRDAHPDVEISLHLHDTRGLGIANAYAGLEMGVTRFDAAVAGLGGCPFAKHKGAAGNVCTEDLVFLCQDMGIETGIDLEALIDAANFAEEVVGHPLPGSVKTGGSLTPLRAQARATVTA